MSERGEFCYSGKPTNTSKKNDGIWKSLCGYLENRPWMLKLVGENLRSNRVFTLFQYIAPQDTHQLQRGKWWLGDTMWPNVSPGLTLAPTEGPGEKTCGNRGMRIHGLPTSVPSPPSCPLLFLSHYSTDTLQIPTPPCLFICCSLWQMPFFPRPVPTHPSKFSERGSSRNTSLTHPTPPQVGFSPCVPLCTLCLRLGPYLLYCIDIAPPGCPLLKVLACTVPVW